MDESDEQVADKGSSQAREAELSAKFAEVFWPAFRRHCRAGLKTAGLTFLGSASAAALVGWYRHECPADELSYAVAVFGVSIFAGVWVAMHKTARGFWDSARADLAEHGKHLRALSTEHSALTKENQDLAERSRALQERLEDTPVEKTMRLMRQLRYGGHNGVTFLRAAGKHFDRNTAWLSNLVGFVNPPNTLLAVFAPAEPDERRCEALLTELVFLRVLEQVQSAPTRWTLTDLGREVLLQIRADDLERK